MLLKEIIMRCITYSLFAAAFVAGPLVAQDDGYFGPITRWGSKPVEPGVVAKADNDAFKKMASEVAELRNRLRQLEESQGNFRQHVKSQFSSMDDSLKLLQASCDKLQTTDTARKSDVTQVQAVTSGKAMLDDASMGRLETCMKNMEALNKRLDDMSKKQDDASLQLQEMTKINLQVQNTLREVGELKKRNETLEREMVLAQNDIGKLQQDLARARPSTPGDTRSSQSLPLPPDTNANPQQSRSGFTPSATASSNVKLVNSYPSTVSVVVDGIFYSLAPSQTLTLSKAPGYFTYEVIGVQGNTLRTLGTAETLTIQIVQR
jgi:septal ring factor EnvC (AmiA/AmiB activator)